MRLYMDLRPLLPCDCRRHYDWTQMLQQGLNVPIVHVQYSPGSNNGNLHWIWQCTASNIDNALKICHPIIENLKKDIPQYHTRAMRRDAFELFGLVSPNTKKSTVRHLYKELVCDSSAAMNLSHEKLMVMFGHCLTWRMQHSYMASGCIMEKNQI